MSFNSENSKNSWGDDLQIRFRKRAGELKILVLQTEAENNMLHGKDGKMSNKRSSGQMARPIFLHQLFLKMTGLKTAMHGCHSTFRDRCSENRINDTVAKKCLMLVTGNIVVQIY